MGQRLQLRALLSATLVAAFLCAWSKGSAEGPGEERPGGGGPRAGAQPASGGGEHRTRGTRLAALVATVPQTAPSSAEPDSGTLAPVHAEVTASKSEVTVGEAFAVEVTASGPPGTVYTFPAGASEEALDLRTPGAGAAGDRGDAPPPVPGTHRYEAAVFALGTVSLPPIPVRYRLPDGTEGQVETEPVTVEVVSMLPKDPDAQKLVDIRGPRPATVGRAFWIAVISALVIVAALVAWIVRRRRRPAGEVAVAAAPEVPPDVEALRALADLAADRLVEGGAFRTFYIRLTAVAKRYLERRLGAPVLEMTTAETLALLRGLEHGADVLPVVRDLAAAADRIKFARGQGLGPEAERHLDSVRALVPALEARLRPEAPDAPEQGKAA